MARRCCVSGGTVQHHQRLLSLDIHFRKRFNKMHNDTDVASSLAALSLDEVAVARRGPETGESSAYAAADELPGMDDVLHALEQVCATRPTPLAAQAPHRSRPATNAWTCVLPALFQAGCAPPNTRSKPFHTRLCWLAVLVPSTGACMANPLRRLGLPAGRAVAKGHPSARAPWLRQDVGRACGGAAVRRSGAPSDCSLHRGRLHRCVRLAGPLSSGAKCMAQQASCASAFRQGQGLHACLVAHGWSPAMQRVVRTRAGESERRLRDAFAAAVKDAAHGSSVVILLDEASPPARLGRCLFISVLYECLRGWRLSRPAGCRRRAPHCGNNRARTALRRSTRSARNAAPLGSTRRASWASYLHCWTGRLRSGPHTSKQRPGAADGRGGQLQGTSLWSAPPAGPTRLTPPCGARAGGSRALPAARLPWHCRPFAIPPLLPGITTSSCYLDCMLSKSFPPVASSPLPRNILIASSIVSCLWMPPPILGAGWNRRC